MKRVYSDNKSLDNCYYVDNDGRSRIIDYIYYRGQLIWELIIGFLFSKDDASLQTKDDFIIKAKDQ